MRSWASLAACPPIEPRQKPMLDVGHRGLDHAGECGGLDAQEPPTLDPHRGDPAQVEPAVLGVVRAEREHVNVVELGHDGQRYPPTVDPHGTRHARAERPP
jgi:hypothetical protein